MRWWPNSGRCIAAVFLYDEDNNSIRPAYSINYPAEMLAQIERVRIETPTLANLALITGEVQIASLLGEHAPPLPTIRATSANAWACMPPPPCRCWPVAAAWAS